ncbi:AAC(3) family N-acetyltransferase [Campylobacter jejuni]|uniref:AAC(3) family N-acetyltransferase n=1 Tax=Campylobacter jejuni TaxID=197 RepID=UPI00069A1FDA|nr:AAC(3) family N-acetyltransferase [Campylobacter jejuni]BEK05908.1 N-acetyltransferase LegH [Campylobacter jejuni]
MKKLLKYNNKIYTQEDLINILIKLGIKHGDIICVHTEIFHFQKPLLPKNEFLNALLECLIYVIGGNGTLIMPTFTYSFCKNKPYDKSNSKCTVGVLNEFFRKQKNVKRTDDPIFSFAIKGAKENIFLKRKQQSCFDKNSVYNILAQHKGKIILLGSETTGFTFTHFIEEQAQVPYRYFKEFEGNIIYENKECQFQKIKYYVRKLNENSRINILKQISILKNNNNFKVQQFANAKIVCIDSKSYLDTTLKALQENLYCLL